LRAMRGERTRLAAAHVRHEAATEHYARSVTCKSVVGEALVAECEELGDASQENCSGCFAIAEIMVDTLLRVALPFAPTFAMNVVSPPLNLQSGVLRPSRFFSLSRKRSFGWFFSWTNHHGRRGVLCQGGDERPWPRPPT
jgi:hypothetical protein